MPRRLLPLVFVSLACAPTLTGDDDASSTTGGSTDADTTADTTENTTDDGGDAETTTGTNTDEGPGACSPQPSSGPYTMCLDQSPCAMTEVCLGVANDIGEIVDGHCTNPCVSDAQCGMVDGCAALPRCVSVGGDNRVCILTCEGADDCPVGMACTESGDGTLRFCV